MTAPSTMRGSNRSPPFVVVGFAVALCLVSFYYWRVSSRNSELELQLETQRGVLRNEITKRDDVEKRAMGVSKSLKSCEEDMQRDKSLLVEKENNIKSLNEQVHKGTEETENSKKEKSECDGNLKKCQDDTNGIRQELEKLKDDIKKREEELKTLKAASPNQNCNCDAALQEQRKNIENILLKAVGDQAVQALKQNDQGKAAEGAQQPQPPQPQQPGAQQPQPQQPGAQQQQQAQQPAANFLKNYPGYRTMPSTNSFDKIAKDGLERNTKIAAVKTMPVTIKPTAHDRATSTRETTVYTINNAAEADQPAKLDDKKAGDEAGGAAAEEKDEANIDADGDHDNHDAAAANVNAGNHQDAADANAADAAAPDKEAAAAAADKEDKNANDDGNDANENYDDSNADADGDVVGKVGMDDLTKDDLDKSDLVTHDLDRGALDKDDLDDRPDEGEYDDDYTYDEDEYNDVTDNQKVIDDAQGDSPLKFEGGKKSGSDKGKVIEVGDS